MRTIRQIRLFSLISILWTLWHVLYLEVKQQYSFVGKEGSAIVPPDFHRYMRGHKRSIEHHTQDSNIDIVEEEREDVNEQTTAGDEVQHYFTGVSPLKKKENDRDKLKSKARKRRRARERATRKESDFKSDVTRRIRELTTSRTPPSEPQQSSNGQSWMDNRSNALPEFKEGEPLATRKERIKGYMPMRRSIVFVHLGKAAGRTIQQTFKAGCYAFQGQRRRRPCLTRLRQLNETILSQSVKTRMHCDRIGPTKDIHTATTFLWSTRDPIDRIASWFDYTNPANCLEKEPMAVNCQVNRFYREGWVHDVFRLCFSSAESFIASLKDPTIGSEVATTTGVPCNKLAWMGILGLAPANESSHLYFNYEFYKNATISMYPEKEIMVVRTEFLWDDLTSVERRLGGNATFNSAIYGIDGTHGSRDYPYKTMLTAGSQQILCCAIKDEISVYVDLITSATNLNATTREESLNALAAKCNVPNLGLLSMACDATMGNAYDLLSTLGTAGSEKEQDSTR
jgi:hypothetical protein